MDRAFPAIDSPASAPAQQMRAMLARARFNTEMAAKALDVDKEVLRHWCIGTIQPPREIILALGAILDAQRRHPD